jgi:hypothetical protein
MPSSQSPDSYHWANQSHSKDLSCTFHNQSEIRNTFKQTPEIQSPATLQLFRIMICIIDIHHVKSNSATLQLFRIIIFIIDIDIHHVKSNSMLAFLLNNYAKDIKKILSVNSCI